MMLRGTGWAHVREAIQTLNPGYFALVMATGIMSIAMHQQHAYHLSKLLLWLTVPETMRALQAVVDTANARLATLLGPGG